jgi:hypothetical protein
MVPGDRVRLAHLHRLLSPGTEGIVAGFSRSEARVFVTVHIEGHDEVIPEAGLAVVRVRAGPWDGSSLARSPDPAR